METNNESFSNRQFLRAAPFLAGRKGKPCAKFARHTMSSKFQPKSHKTNGGAPHKVTHKTSGACIRLRDWDITARGCRITKRQSPAGRHTTAEVNRESVGAARWRLIVWHYWCCLQERLRRHCARRMRRRRLRPLKLRRALLPPQVEHLPHGHRRRLLECSWPVHCRMARSRTTSLWPRTCSW